MNLNAIKYFMEVAKTLSFTQASKNLYVSQPSISQQVRLLEKQLGVKLLNRTTRQVTLTDEGKYLYKHVYPKMLKIDNTLKSLKQLKSSRKKIKISTIPMAAQLYMPILIKQLYAFDDALEVKIEEENSAQTIERVSKGSSDIGFIRTHPFLNYDDLHQLEKLHIESFSFKVVVAANHPLASKKAIKFKKLKDFNFVQYAPVNSESFYEVIENLFAEKKFQPNTICTCSELLTVLTLIEQNIGFTLIPENMLRLFNTKHTVALDLEDVNLQSSVTMIWQQNKLDDTYLKVIADTFHGTSSKNYSLGKAY